MKSEEILEFERLYFEFSIFGNQRYGQAFCNYFSVDNDDKLFYEENDEIARDIVWAKYAE